MKSYQCPSCGGIIELESINVTTDVALCRQCGQTTSFSVLSEILELSEFKIEQPPRGVQITEDMAGVKTIRYKRISPILLFLIPFTCVWSGGSVGGIYGSQIHKGQFDLIQSLFGLPFLFGSILLLAVILFLLFGKWVIQIRRGEIEVFAGIGRIGKTRRFSCTSRVVVSLAVTSAGRHNNPGKIIQIQAGEEKFRFGSTMPEPVKQYIAAILMKENRRI